MRTELVPLRDLDRLCDLMERRTDIRRPPDFQLMYDPTVNWRLYQPVLEQEAVFAAIERRRQWVATFAISMFGTIALGAFCALVFLPL